MDQYIRYHKKPYANYLDVKAFNKKYGTDIPEVEHYDEYFHATFTQAKQMQGPDDFLQVKFATHDEFEEMGLGSFLRKKFPKAAKQADELAEKAKKAAGDAKKAIDNKLDEAAAARIKKQEIKPVQEDNLDALLSDDENILEAEYDETEAPVTNIVTEKKKITDLVKASSLDTKAFEQDMKYLIQFKNAKFPLRDQLMKGRPKYMKALKAYVKGDKKAEVKMSWKEGKNKMVRVASLNPDIKSLKAILRQTPGTMRIVECL